MNDSQVSIQRRAAMTPVAPAAEPEPRMSFASSAAVFNDILTAGTPSGSVSAAVEKIPATIPDQSGDAPGEPFDAVELDDPAFLATSTDFFAPVRPKQSFWNVKPGVLDWLNWRAVVPKRRASRHSKGRRPLPNP